MGSTCVHVAGQPDALRAGERVCVVFSGRREWVVLLSRSRYNVVRTNREGGREGGSSAENALRDEQLNTAVNAAWDNVRARERSIRRWTGAV